MISSCSCAYDAVCVCVAFFDFILCEHLGTNDMDDTPITSLSNEIPFFVLSKALTGLRGLPKEVNNSTLSFSTHPAQALVKRRRDGVSKMTWRN